MKKIALIYTGMNRGGAQRVLVDIAKNIRELDFEVIIISDGGPLIEEIKSANIPHYELPLKSKKINNVIKSIKGLIKIINDENISIIHSHHRYTTLLSNLIKPIVSIPVVHTEHNVFPNKNFINFRGKNIIAVSNKVKEHLLNNRINESDIIVIKNGIEIDEKRSNYDLREELKLDKECILIGVLARLVKEKGHEFMINSIYELLIKYKNIKVVFIGDGEERERIEEKINVLELTDKIILLGNRKDVNTIIESINFFVLPSFYEGLPMSILEIMAKQKLIIATDVGGNKEVIDSEVNGYLIESGNSVQLNEKIEFCINNMNNLIYLEKNAAKTIRKKFSIERVIKDHAEYYSKILEKNYL